MNPPAARSKDSSGLASRSGSGSGSSASSRRSSKEAAESRKASKESTEGANNAANGTTPEGEGTTKSARIDGFPPNFDFSKFEDLEGFSADEGSAQAINILASDRTKWKEEAKSRYVVPEIDVSPLPFYLSRITVTMSVR